MFYGQNTNVEDIDRNKEVADLRARLDPVHQRRLKLERTLNKIKDWVLPNLVFAGAESWRNSPMTVSNK
jgi:hypothetical protein